jgi:hypothetical protein
VHNALNALIEQKPGSLSVQLGLVVGLLEAIPLVFALDSTVISAANSIDSIGDLAPVGFPQSAPADIEAHVFELEEQDINGGVGP